MVATSVGSVYEVDFAEFPSTSATASGEFFARAFGWEVTKEPFAFPGGRRFHFREPGGSELAVWWPG